MCGANTSEKRDASEDSRVRLMIQTLIECHLQILSVFQLPGVQDQYRVWYVPVGNGIKPVSVCSHVGRPGLVKRKQSKSVKQPLNKP